MVRLFVAVWPPAAVVEALAREVPRPNRPGLRWVPPENWHVTLRFLGSADPTEVSVALDRLVVSPTEAVVGPTVTTLGRAVVCLPVAGLDPLAAAVRAVTAGIGPPPEHRGFTGHVTLARRRGRTPVPTGVRFEARFPVGEVTLVASDTRPTGAEYRVLRAWPLPWPPDDAR